MLAWAVVGIIVGAIFVYTRKQQTGSIVLLDVVVGIIGGFIGGAALFAVGGLVGTEVIGVNLGGVIVALVGAVILDAILQLMIPTPEQ
jgi:uncharacterized membrane protein YeaQ/YmgE (transglycosylase-associated protein family)